MARLSSPDWRVTVTVLAALFLLLAGCSSLSTGDMDGPEGTWGIPEPGQPEVTLEEGGHAYGTDGCNQFTGSWRLEGEAGQDGTTVVFSDMTSTLMACDGMDTWFTRTVSATVHGDVLHCFDAEGSEIGTLPRQ